MILKCRSCESTNIKNVLSLGFSPLANALLTKDKLETPEEKYPLDLVYCEECTLVQIVETVPPEKLFSEYFYHSSISKTVLDNARDIAGKMFERLGLNGENRVLEIGCNDGYLLKNYVEMGVKCIGVEPAQNVAEEARKNLGPETKIITGFFNLENAKKLAGVGSKEIDSKRYGWTYKADVIHANNVLAHVNDIHGVIEGIRTLLSEDGVAVVETHYIRDLVEKNQFDCIYHEHLCYYSAHSLAHLFELHGMEMVDVERIPIHGGSLRAYFQIADGPKSFAEQGKDRVESFLMKEHNTGVTSFEFYEGMMQKIISLKERLLRLLEDIKRDDLPIAAYGASAKSTTLMNFFGIDESYIDFVVDDTPDKQGHYSPGTLLPIVPASELAIQKPAYVLILTWNFAKEIMEKNQNIREWGGRFIVPIPELEMI